ncbi:MAG TPA: outer membrane lipoprotein-sorting protein [Bryobacteraceae bacterium]|jgi:outer membrane lipoprotein-sorting protein|nr:outer membrane lipoprotein-sorting protein [Bryobacteraceae bacterium]
MSKFRWLLLLLTLPAMAQSAREIAEEAQRRAKANSQHYEGTLRVMDGKSKVAEKRWAYDRIGSSGASKVVLRFQAPAEVKGVGLLVMNHPDRASDQWMWTPALGRERRIALQDRSSRFFGTDFSFEDLEERDVNQYDYKLLGEETVDGVAMWKLESKPKKTSQYTRSELWIRKDNYAVARIDNYKGAKLARQILYSDLAQVQGIWTPKRHEVFDAMRNSRTILLFDKLQYNVAMKDEDFTLQALRRD